jgi:hypothetical protein
MAKTSVFEPLFDDGLASINFFNGRLLSAEDLTTERKANREALRRLGQAIRDGVVSGLEVRTSAAETPTVTVTAGLAINRRGDALRLENDTDVSLLARQAGVGTTIVKVFEDCVPPRAGAYRPSDGAYLLTISPAKVGRGLAPVSGLGSEQAACNRKYVVEGVQFSLITIPELPAELADSSLSASGTLRNRLAHFCLGSHEMLAVADPLATEPAGSAIDTLRAARSLTDCDVPIALIHWVPSGVEYVDTWAVRRPWFVPDAPFHPGVRVVYSAVRQFQDQVASVTNQGSAQARSNFYYLPPVGRLPVREPRYRSTTGFALRTFFGQKYRTLPSIVGRHDLVPLLRLALDYAPRRHDDVAGVAAFLVDSDIDAVIKGQTSQLHAYFTFVEIARQYCAPVIVVDVNGRLELSLFATTLEGTVTAYQDFRKAFLLNLLPAGTALTREDVAGLIAIDQVLTAAHSVLALTLGGCTGTNAVWAGLKRLADVERVFAGMWLDVVLAQGGGTKYRPEIRQLIQRVKALVETPSFEGTRGLLPALDDQDLFAANSAQVKINQSFAVRVGTGPQGAISIKYSTPPVIPGSSPKIDVSGKYLFGFVLKAEIDREATFRLMPSMQRVGQNGWKATLWDEVEDKARESDTLTLPRSVDTAGGISRNLRVQVEVPANGTSAALVFDVLETSGAGGVLPGREDVEITVGQPPPSPNAKIVISLLAFAGSAVGHGFSISRTATTRYGFEVAITVAGAYTFTMAPADARQWTQLGPDIGGDTVPGQPGATVPVNTITVTGGVQPGANALNTELIFTVRSTSPEISPPLVATFRVPVVIA